MKIITSIILAMFAAYIAAWMTGFGGVQGNFPLILLIATVITGVYWLAEKFYFAPKRIAAAKAFKNNWEQKNIDLINRGIVPDNFDQVQHIQQKILQQPWWLDWTAGLFPVIAIVFILRSFVVEPFKIPSGSMIPTLHIGDLILVNKYVYGLNLPVINKKITKGSAPKNGDVIVFRYPPEPTKDYIKRIIGIPGDKVTYINKELAVNGQKIPRTTRPDFFDQTNMQYHRQFFEYNNGKKHGILIFDQAPTATVPLFDYPMRDSCVYSAKGFECRVPQGHYFVMGDNRDHSEDSRYWGFVPENNIVGKAFFIWMNLGDFKRIGSFE